jgi:hypothetical protein
VFMVYDKETELPVFIGSILDLNHLWVLMWICRNL